MIITTEKNGKEDPYWLLIAAHISGLYRKSTRSPNRMVFSKVLARAKTILLADLYFFSNLLNLSRDSRGTSRGDEDEEKIWRGDTLLSFFFSLSKLLGTNLGFLGFSLTQR